MRIPSSVSMIEVGPRDGLQNEKQMLPTDAKIALVRRLAAAGFREIEVTSFTHPKWIPNLADAEEVVRAVRDLDFKAFALVPNRRGLDRAVGAGIKGVTFVFSATDGHNKRNLNRTTEDSISEILVLEDETRRMGLDTRISLSVVFGCPFEGDVPEERILSIVGRLADAGSTRIGLCDTIGVADPAQVHRLCARLIGRFPSVSFELHLHDTRGRALANMLAGLDAGITAFDAAVGGLGGCPYAPGATGNVATEDAVSMLTAMGVRTGIDEGALLHAASLLADWRDRPLDSATWRTGMACKAA
ncbi:hydroxymethylglutaryl-CoA lyase (plasmid) [Skermanella sp. TT6]|uniref:Hydroxymethylglutaryl-CoA lyase n=1 Tax=Skermanella cutis TaxID=2775420 RepID=A0ABX7BHM6_9PROT|nr:hydroxymethylglutaryl-CoA lyase [Skermanella sp. TT6]QQP93276.1 hydroxymethylglutaryl-CoA lyase [Skermanella sp. TT6]